MIETQVKTIRSHYESTWNTTAEADRWTEGPFYDLPDAFMILRFVPTDSRKMWTYATCGMSRCQDLHRLELHLFSQDASRELVELLTVVAHYHCTESPLGLGHTVNFGRPWFPGSRCEYGLITRPYLDGPRLEWLSIGIEKIRFLWLIPITLEEMHYKQAHGLDALEERFEAVNFNYADPLRKSVI